MCLSILFSSLDSLQSCLSGTSSVVALCLLPALPSPAFPNLQSHSHRPVRIIWTVEVRYTFVNLVGLRMLPNRAGIGICCCQTMMGEDFLTVVICDETSNVSWMLQLSYISAKLMKC